MLATESPFKLIDGNQAQTEELPRAFAPQLADLIVEWDHERLVSL